MSEAHIFAIGILLAWLAGIRAYLTVFGVGLAGWLGWVELPPALQITQSWWVLGTAGTLALVEFFTDKIPGVDSAWDLLQTVARIPAGAFLAAATLSPDGDLGPGALSAGAGIALTSHLLKTGSRTLLNTSPEPLSNWTASITEDALVTGALVLAIAHPWAALVSLVSISLIGAAVIWAIWRALRGGVRRVMAIGRPAPDSIRP